MTHISQRRTTAMLGMTTVILLGMLVGMGAAAATSGWSDLHLPEEHIPEYLYSHPDVRQQCLQDSKCPYKETLQSDSVRCWGYEEGCPQLPRMPQCPSDNKWVKDKTAQIQTFWDSADFGYITQRRKELRSYCTPSKPEDSSLECVDHLRYCQASNIFIDLSTAKLASASNPYREDVLSAGQIGGRCRLDKAALTSQLDHKSPLQSWAAEMEHFVSIAGEPLSSKRCDVVISRPTYIIKLDATVNMYHHFCDYINLYISQHFNHSFSLDVNVLIWDTSGHSMSTMFAETWKAFTNYPPLQLNQYDGKTVCFKQALFSFLARMRRGLYYNMPLIDGCHGSSLMKAFSHHLVHRLQLPQGGPLQNKIRVTVLSRSTRYRQILNQVELVRALQTDFEFEVRKVDFVRSMSFLEQIKISHNSDIFIGMHGAGLTHMLFQPDWAVVMELYNCEDAGCYYDLARLRGIHYMTWENPSKLHQQDEGHHPTLGAHAKFTNYAFDVDEFMRLMQQAAERVRSHPAFIAARNRKFAAPEPSSAASETNASESDPSPVQQQSPKSGDHQHHSHSDL